MKVAEKESIMGIHHGRNLLRVRRAREIQRNTLAKEIGTETDTIIAMEQQEIIDEKWLKKLSTALEVPVEVFTLPFEDSPIQIIENSEFNNSQIASIQNSFTFNSNDKLIELYEKLLAEEKEKNKQLIKKISELESYLNK